MKRTGAMLLILLAGHARAEELYADPAAAATPDYYPETPQDRVYIQSRDGGGHGGGGGGGGHGGGYAQPSYGYQPPQDPLIPNLYPTAILGGLGCLGMAYFKHVIDQSYNKSLHAFENLHHNVDHRLEHLEEMMSQDGKDNKKLDFKTKALCKFANLFNNPTYEICNQGFDGGQVVGPTGSPHSGYGFGQGNNPGTPTAEANVSVVPVPATSNSADENDNSGGTGGTGGRGDATVAGNTNTNIFRDDNDFRSGPGEGRF